jgi:hypothetical protein
MVEGHRVGGGSFQAGPAHGGEDGKVRGSGQVFLAEGQAVFLLAEGQAFFLIGKIENFI